MKRLSGVYSAGDNVADVYEQIEKQMNEMYALDDMKISEVVGEIVNVMKQCVVTDGEEIDRGGLDEVTNLLVNIFLEIEEHKKTEEELMSEN